MSFIVTTTAGSLVYKSEKKPLTREQAQSSADDRNRRAEQMGLIARYEVREAWDETGADEQAAA